MPQQFFDQHQVFLLEIDLQGKVMAAGMGRKVKRRQTGPLHNVLKDAAQEIRIGRFDSVFETENRAAFIRKRETGFPTKVIPFPAVLFQSKERRVVQRNIPVAAAFTGTDIDLLFVAVDITKGQRTGFR